MATRTAKPCARCGGKKGPKYARKKYCGKCQAAVKRAAADRAHRAYVWKTYNVDYDKLYEEQGGVCYICRRATGTYRRLAVDHDHTCCPGTTSCGKCVRGLLCKRDNRMIGYAFDDPEHFDRAAEYLRNPPARRYG